MKAGAEGGIDAVVKAINTHIDNAGMCEKGCDVLMSMTFNNGKNTVIKHEMNTNS